MRRAAHLLLVILSARAAGACDNERAERVFDKCSACHVRDSSGVHGLGPNLAGVVGRNAGSAAGFGYSEAMRNRGAAWTESDIAAFLADPGAWLPGTSMAFPGLPRPEDRTAIACWLARPID